MSNKTTPPLRGTPLGVAGETTTPPLRGTPPQEGNKWQWQGKPDSQFPSVGGVSRSDGVVPKLRFPEFRGAGVWGVKRLGEVATFFKGKGLPKSAITPNGKIPCIHYGELFTEYREVIRAVKSYTDIDENIFLSIENDVLMPTSDVTPSGLAKACCIKLNDVILGGDVLVIRTSEKSINGEFLARYIRHVEQKVLQLVSGSTVFHLYATSINKLLLFIPQKQEQQKIADCLSSLDDLISAQTQKLAALKIHKKGLMQQLFPTNHPAPSGHPSNGGEAVPKLRFPEFRGAGAWGEIELDRMVTLEYGSSLPKTARTMGSFPIVGSNGIVGFHNVAIAKGPAIVIGRKGSAGQLNWINSDCFPIDTTFFVKCLEPENFLMQFIFLLLMNCNLEQLIDDSAVPGINRHSIYVLKVFLPKLPEQQKIADCLSSLDDLISAQAQKLAALKTHKKGLMQQLFPSCGGVAGEA